MFRCSRCNQSRWVHVRFGTLADDLERLTGWTPYWCQACERRGWYHSRPTPPAVDELRRLSLRFWLARLSLVRLSAARFSLARLSPGRLALKTWRNRVPAAMLNGRLLASAGGLVCTFVLGLWMGPLLFSGPTVGADRENVTAAHDVAPKRIAPNVPEKAPVESEPARKARPAVTPPGGDSLPAVTAPVAGVRPAVTPQAASPRRVVKPPVENLPAAVAPTGEKQRLRSPLTAPKPVTRAATARDRRQPHRTASRVKPVPRAPAADTRTSAVRAAVAPAPVLPRFHGSLAINSEPRGALVWVDGQVVGPTPVLLKGVRAGSRVVRIESEGYERWSSAARVIADQNTAIVATLQRN